MLDHFIEASRLDGTDPDPRLAEAVDAIRAARRDDGTWIRAAHMPGLEWFDVDAPVGEPSPWLTYYAARIPRWWDEAHAAAI